MLQKMLRNIVPIIMFCLAIVGFGFIRNFEDVLFYDPFLVFFRGKYNYQPVPVFIEWKLYLSLFFRYLVNTLLSLFVLFVLFKSKEFLKLASILYVFFFVVLLLLFMISLHFFSDRLMLLFYVRRFLIQPLFLLLFVPGFYFQQYDMKKQKR